MSATALVAGAAQTASRIRDAAHFRPFRHAVDDFIRVLGSVPDRPAGTLTSDDLRTIELLGNDVIDRIEDRVDGLKSAADAQELVKAVYEIRRLLEEANRFRQHYFATARPV